MKKFISILIFLIAGFCSTLHSQDISVSANVDRNLAYIGEPITLKLSIKGFSLDDPDVSIEVPSVKGLTIKQEQSYSTSSFSIVINGKQVSGNKEEAVEYSVNALQPGIYTIPPIEIKIGSKSLQTKSFEIKFSEPPKDSGMRLDLVLSKEICYVNEPVTATYKWYIAKDVARADIQLPLVNMKDRFHVIPISPEGVKTIDVSVNGNQKQLYKAGITQETFDGITYTVYSIAFKIYSNLPGIVSIKPARITANIKVGMVDRGWPYGLRPKYKKIAAVSQSKTLAINPLPEENKPEHFNNNVGDYKFEVITGDKTVKEMEPILLKMRISGDGLLESVNRPVLSEVKTLTDKFDFVEDTSPGEIKKNAVIFEQIIKPKSMDVTQIPEIPFSFFDTEKGIYKTVYSQAIPIKVLKNELVSITQSTSGQSQTMGSSIVKKQVELKKSGIYANYNHSDIIDSQRVNLLSLWWLVLLPPFSYLFLLLFVNRYKRMMTDKKTIRAKKAKKYAQQYLSDAISLIDKEGKEFYDSLSKGFSSFVNNKLNLGSGEITSLDIERLSDKGIVPKDIRDEAVIILEMIDEGRFGISRTDKSSRQRLIDSLEKLINKFDRLRK